MSSRINGFIGKNNSYPRTNPLSDISGIVSMQRMYLEQVSGIWFDSTATFCIVRRDNSPAAQYLFVYYNSTFASVTTLPATATFAASDISYNFQYIASLGSNTLVSLHKKNGDAYSLIASDTNLTGAIALRISPDSTHLAVAGQSSSPFLFIYNIAGDTLTKISASTTISPTYVYTVTYSPDSTHLVVGRNAAGAHDVYKRTGDTYALLTSLNNGAPSSASGYGFWSVYSKDGVYLAIYGIYTNNSGQMYIYKRSGDTYNNLTSINLAYNANYAAWSPDGTHLAVASSDTGILLRIWKRTGDTFTQLTGLPTPANTPTQLTYSPDGNYLMFYVSGNPPVIGFWQRSGDTYTSIATPGSIAGVGTAYVMPPIFPKYR